MERIINKIKMNKKNIIGFSLLAISALLMAYGVFYSKPLLILGCFLDGAAFMLFIWNQDELKK